MIIINNLLLFLKGININNTFSSVSRGLNIINKIIPLYSQIKPSITGIKNLINNNDPLLKNTKEEIKKEIVNLNNPQFFQ